MVQKTTHPGGRAFTDVLAFTFRHWRAQPVRIAGIAALALATALGDVLTPLFAGRLVDALSHGVAAADKAAAWSRALHAFGVLIGIGLACTLLRQAVFRNIIVLTLKMMSEIAANAFHRVQRFSTDWHANSFAGSTVRKITRGMWAIDLLNDTLLVALLPSIVMLTGATLLLGLHWPVMGAVVGGGSVVFIAVTVAMSLRYVAPAARLGNLWDTRMGGALADAVSCNPVVKAFGAETREETRLDGVVSKWRARTRRAWRRGTLNGGVQGAMLAAMQAAILGAALWLWAHDRASIGDITFALTTFLVLQGYLRDIGMHIRNLQRSVNDMEELVSLERQPLGIDDKPGAKPISIARGEIRFEHVTFGYSGAHAKPLYENFSIRIAPGERVGLVGHSGSGKTSFIKLIQRLYDVDGGHITIDGQDIAEVTQASLRSQIAIVQQEPLLFHRTLAENIAYARPGATRDEIERARVHRRVAAGLRHARRRTRDQAAGRRAAARRDRACVPRRRAGADPRRSDVEPRQRERSADPAGDGAADGRAHDARRRAPAVDGARARPADRARQGARDRGRQPRRADPARRRRLPAAVRAAGARAREGADRADGRHGRRLAAR